MEYLTSDAILPRNFLSHRWPLPPYLKPLKAVSTFKLQSSTEGGCGTVLDLRETYQPFTACCAVRTSNYLKYLVTAHGLKKNLKASKNHPVRRNIENYCPDVFKEKSELI